MNWRDSITTTGRFTLDLPKDVIVPEIYLDENEGDHCVEIDWNEGSKRILSVSIEGSTVTYACILEDEKAHGEFEMHHQIKKTLREIIIKYFTKEEK